MEIDSAPGGDSNGQQKAATCHKQKTLTLRCIYTYLQIRMTLDGSPGAVESSQKFLSCLSAALVQAYGAAGSALQIEDLSFLPDRGVHIVKCFRKDYSRLWAAATTLTNLEGQKCRLEVVAMSPFLVSLGNNSRNFAARIEQPRGLVGGIT
ncbi:hypothetical protein KFL_004720030 [Klebsormidium nitens]|uniref:Uncharacterized protein n=1 Tax=Klebsormidium nitens TaxID=105231 RepID=A0A0U9HTL4_KLENI|nr:hypothetical protein KFL_004720030 [Klebsormidium nitens]|eukprot:GAQ88944.1 hypothetical protein KFL_004720030 [Klebsormidium nitens]